MHGASHARVKSQLHAVKWSKTVTTVTLILGAYRGRIQDPWQCSTLAMGHASSSGLGIRQIPECTG